MGNVDRSFNEAATPAPAPKYSGARDVPADWFVDPAETGRQQDEEASKVLTPAEETAAFLLAQDASNDLVAAPTPSWAPSLDALCAQTDPEAFFPEKGGSTRDAKRVCGACNVRSECLEYALTNDERFGIWGGLSERERRRLRKRAV